MCSFIGCTELAAHLPNSKYAPFGKFQEMSAKVTDPVSESLPIQPQAAWEFDPDAVPTVQELVEQLQEVPVGTVAKVRRRLLLPSCWCGCCWAGLLPTTRSQL